MGALDWLNQDALMERAEGKRGDQFSQREALWRLRELSPSAKLAACYERIVLGNNSYDVISTAVSNFGNLYNAHYRNAFLRTFEEAARQNCHPPGLFRESEHQDLRPDSAPPIIRAARYLIAHGNGHDGRLETCKFMLRRIGTSEALSALRSLEGDIARLRQANIPSLHSRALNSGSQTEVIDAIEKLVQLLPDDEARKALKDVKYAPDRTLTYRGDYETDAGNLSSMEHQSSFSSISYSLSEQAKREWASL